MANSRPDTVCFYSPIVIILQLAALCNSLSSEGAKLLRKPSRIGLDMEGSADDFCYWVLGLDHGIRFAGLANSKGKLLGGAYRKGLKPLLTKEEAEVSFLTSFTKITTHAEMESKFGQMVYALAMYENVKRTTIPIKELSKK